MSELIDDNPWKDFALEEDHEEYVLDSDKEAIDENNQRSQKAKSYRNKKLRTELFPMPFVGDIDKAKIYILQANPGIELAPVSDQPVDINTQNCEKFRKSAQSCLQQNFDENDYPFYFLDPELWWLDGSRWWREKLKKIIKKIVIENLNECFEEDELIEYWKPGETEKQETIENEIESKYKHLSEKICAVEIHGYRSNNYRSPKPEIPSSEFQAKIISQAIKKDACLILIRAEKDWKTLLSDHGEGKSENLYNTKKLIKSSSNQNATISKNNLEMQNGSGDEPFEMVINELRT